MEEDAVLSADDLAATVEQLPGGAVSLPVFIDTPPTQGKAKRQKTGKAAAKAAAATLTPGQNQNPVQVGPARHLGFVSIVSHASCQWCCALLASGLRRVLK